MSIKSQIHNNICYNMNAVSSLYSPITCEHIITVIFNAIAKADQLKQNQYPAGVDYINSILAEEIVNLMQRLQFIEDEQPEPPKHHQRFKKIVPKSNWMKHNKHR